MCKTENIFIYNCDINVKDDDNEALSHLACYVGHLDVVEYLSDNESCDLHAKDEKGRNKNIVFRIYRLIN